MQGFKEFIMRGNLIELAVAFVMGVAFAAVVESFTEIIMNALAKLGGLPDFTGISIAGVEVGTFLTALVTFLIISFVVYFAIVMPYNKARERFMKKEEEPEVTSEMLLAEIRDLLATNRHA